MFYEKQYKNDDGSIFPVNRSGLLDSAGSCDHFFCMRRGGVSTGVYEDLDLSFTMGDDPEDVTENFRRAMAHLNRSIEDIVFTDQMHTVNIRNVTAEDKGKGILTEKDYSDIDALITDEPGIVLSVFTADCVPLLFADGRRGVIASAHSGWKGTIGRIGAKVVREMQDKYGCRIEDIRCAAGPCICGNCYEVSRELADMFRKEFPYCTQDMIWDTVPGKSHLDLKAVNRMLLEEAGLLPGNIDISERCTFCEPEMMFSHRRLGKRRGNMGAFITM